MAEEDITAKLVLVDGTAITAAPNPVPGNRQEPPQVVYLRNNNITIGRAGTTDVTLVSLQISRNHASLEYIGRKWFIKDLSTNGIHVNSEQLVKGKLRELKDGDIISYIPQLTYKFEAVHKTESPKKSEVPAVPAPVDLSDSDSDSLPSIYGEVEGQDFYCEPTSPEPHSTKHHPAVELVSEESDVSPAKKLKMDVVNEIVLGTEYEAIKKLGVNELRQLLVDKTKQTKKLENEIEDMRMERACEREEWIQTRNSEVQSQLQAKKEEWQKSLLQVIESEFSCSICSDVFIHPMIIACGHTFCRFCILEWCKKKFECPVCRSHLTVPPAKHIEIDNILTKLYNLLGEDTVSKRMAQVKERDQEKVTQSKVNQNNRRRNAIIPEEILNLTTSMRRGATRRRRSTRNRNAVATAQNNNPNPPDAALGMGVPPPPMYPPPFAAAPYVMLENVSLFPHMSMFRNPLQPAAGQSSNGRRDVDVLYIE